MLSFPAQENEFSSKKGGTSPKRKLSDCSVEGVPYERTGPWLPRHSCPGFLPFLADVKEGPKRSNDLHSSSSEDLVGPLPPSWSKHLRGQSRRPAIVVDILLVISCLEAGMLGMLHGCFSVQEADFHFSPQHRSGPESPCTRRRYVFHLLLEEGHNIIAYRSLSALSSTAA